MNYSPLIKLAAPKQLIIQSGKMGHYNGLYIDKNREAHMKYSNSGKKESLAERFFPPLSYSFLKH